MEEPVEDGWVEEGLLVIENGGREMEGTDIVERGGVKAGEEG